MVSSDAPVVVGYDGSPDADRALEWGAATAGLFDRPLRVVVAQPSPRPLEGDGRDWERQHADEAVAQAEERTSAVGRAEADVLRVHGDPVPVLVGESRSAYVVVTGSRGLGVASGMLLGSVSLHLAHHAACPLVVARSAHRPSSRTIVVGVDGSAHSTRPVGFACERAARTGEEVALLYGWRLGERPWAELYGPPDARTVAQTDEAERLLRDAASAAREDWPDVQLRTEQAPVRPGQFLVDAAANASLLVVGDRGRGAFTGMLLGSVSQHVLQHAPCPVAIIR